VQKEEADENPVVPACGSHVAILTITSGFTKEYANTHPMNIRKKSYDKKNYELYRKLLNKINFKK